MTYPTRLRGLVAALAAITLASTAAAQGLPSPEERFGHRMGADRRLVSYDEFLPYLEQLAEASDRVNLRTIGTTTQGRPLVMLEISTPENLAQSERYKRIARQLDDPRGLSQAQLDSLTAHGKVVLMVTLNIHSTEIAASQMGLEWVYTLATGGPESPAQYLRDVIVLVIPSVNPDGQVMVTDWYRKHVGTRYEGSAMPWLYHPYAGHDNNRDWFMLNLAETRAVNRVAYHEWFPQVLLDEHQMGSTGPRAFVPPYADPVSERVHPLVHRGAMLFGAAMAMDLEMQGMSGVIYGYSFDAYWPGGTRSTPWWKNTIGVLTEIASARLATPIYVDPSELTGGRKGLPDYRAQVNFPNPWPGGWWTQRDIVDYELVLTNSALRVAAQNRRALLSNRARMAADAVAAGHAKPPYAYVVTPDQHDRGTASALVDVLVENGIEAFRLTESVMLEGGSIPEGSILFPTAQPYRSFLVEMLEPQEYPRVRLGPATDEFHLPYDVTSWALPLLMGVTVLPLTEPLDHLALEPLPANYWTAPLLVEGPGTLWALSPASNASYTAVCRLLDAKITVRQATTAFRVKGITWPAGTFLVDADPARLESLLHGLRLEAHRVAVTWAESEATLASVPATGSQVTTRRLRPLRVGVYQSWLASMDEGWTRYVLDSFEFPYTLLHDDDIHRGNLGRAYDVILLPDLTPSELVDGRADLDTDGLPRRPEPYDGGLGRAGVDQLARFVAEGGTLVAMGNACDLAMDELGVPVRNATGSLSSRQFSTPGAMLRVSVDTTHPLGYGMPAQALVYHHTDPVLATQVPGADVETQVVARYAPRQDVVASGWVRGEKYLERRGAVADVRMGEGRVVLLAFRPQYRGQTHGTYRFLFNALLSAQR